MKTLTELLLIFTVFAAVKTVWGSVDHSARQEELFILSQRALNDQDIDDICQKNITPHQAAQTLRIAGLMVNHSRTFAPFLHELYYRLGQCTHRRDLQWTPETMDICVRLMRYIALFRSLQQINIRGHEPAIICAIPELPDNPCKVLNSCNETAVQHIFPGATANIPLAMLPRKALGSVQIKIERWKNRSGDVVNIPSELCSVRYRLQNGGWEYTLSRKLPQKLLSGIAFLQLSVRVPGSLPPGDYSNTIRISSSNKQCALRYTLKVQPLTEEK